MFKVAYAIGVLPRAKKFDPHLGFLGSTIDNVFFLGGRQSASFGPRIPSREGLWTRSVRTEI